jgi:integrase
MSEIIDAHLQWMEDERYAPSSILDRRRTLYRADHALPRGLCDVYTHELRTYLNQARWSAWTMHTYDQHLRGFYGWAYRSRWLTLDPMAELRSPPGGAFLPKPLTATELRLALDRSAHSPLWYTCIILGVGAGLRAAEMAGLRREDVTDEYLHVRRGKGGKARMVTTCPAVWAHLANHPGGPVLRRAYSDAPVTGNYLSSAQAAHWRSIGLPQIHLHRLRHTFATVMYEADQDALVIRDLMGHTSVATTQGYALVSGRKRGRAVAAVDAVLTALASRTPASL